MIVERVMTIERAIKKRRKGHVKKRRLRAIILQEVIKNSNIARNIEKIILAAPIIF